MIATHSLPMVLAEVAVRRVERLSPSFVRVELGADELAEFGVDGPTYDQRIKLVFPARDRLPSIEGADETWLTTWLDRPVEERGHMRTYTVRDVVGTGADTRLVVDLVVHEESGGPGSRWAARATVGDRLVLLAPRRGLPFGGIEFAPPFMTDLVLVGDDTAVPAVAAILAQLPPEAAGTAFLEVPTAADIQHLAAPPGVEVRWLTRAGEHGAALVAEVRRHLGLAAGVVPVSVDEVDPDLWETPAYSSSGEPLDPGSRHLGGDLADLYAWVAGESRMVTTLRRALVRELGVDRGQVAFMGYWREGVAMRS